MIATGVSTHSRPKAAGQACVNRFFEVVVSTHSRPKAAGRSLFVVRLFHLVSTHSRPKAAGGVGSKNSSCYCRFNTQPPEGGWSAWLCCPCMWLVSTHSRPKAAGRVRHTILRRYMSFQHTAARRRLEPLSKALLHQVSQPRFR